MNQEREEINKKYPPNLVLTSFLSGGITITLTLIYILLCIAFLIVRTQCEMGSITSTNGADYFWHTIFRAYILEDGCIQGIVVQKLTTNSALLILVSVTLAISVLCLIAAIALVTIIQDVRQAQYVSYAVYAYIACCVISLIVDLTTASHFGTDYSYVSSLLRQLNAGSPSNYRTEVIRQGAFWLMTFALKGYVIHIINCILLVLLAVYVYKYQKSLKSNEHPIHTLGVISAFDQQRKTDGNYWSQGQNYTTPPYMIGPNTNSAFVEDLAPPRSPIPTDTTRNDYNPNRSFDRPDSWHHSRQNPAPNARPFSYLEDMKRPVQAKLQPPPPIEPQWRREQSPVTESPWRREPSPVADPAWRREPSPVADPAWRRDPWPQNQEPHVPMPDYSPNVPRRLKSALKPAY